MVNVNSFERSNCQRESGGLKNLKFNNKIHQQYIKVIAQPHNSNKYLLWIGM